MSVVTAIVTGSDPMSDLQGLYADVEAAQAELQFAQERLLTEGSRLLPDVLERPGMLHELYWEWDFPIGVLTAATGMSTKQLATAAGSYVFGITCPRCFKRFEVQARSRSELLLIRRQYEGELLCRECLPKLDARYDPRLLLDGKSHARITELRQMPYGEYLKSPEWLETRKAALERAHHQCHICSSRYQLQVHHRTYDRLGAELARDLSVLCSECHGTFHRHGRLRR